MKPYLLDEIDSEDENESSDDTNRKETDHSWTSDENTETTECEERTRDSSGSSNFVEKYRVDLQETKLSDFSTRNARPDEVQTYIAYWQQREAISKNNWKVAPRSEDSQR